MFALTSRETNDGGRLTRQFLRGTRAISAGVDDFLLLGAMTPGYIQDRREQKRYQQLTMQAICLPKMLSMSWKLKSLQKVRRCGVFANPRDPELGRRSSAAETSDRGLFPSERARPKAGLLNASRKARRVCGSDWPRSCSSPKRFLFSQRKKTNNHTPATPATSTPLAIEDEQGEQPAALVLVLTSFL